MPTFCLFALDTSNIFELLGGKGFEGNVNSLKIRADLSGVWGVIVATKLWTY